MIKAFFFLSLFFLNNSQALAKAFTNHFTEFELPTGWECALEGSEWVCQSSNEERKKEAIIILAAKIRGEQDSLDEYQNYLKKTKTYSLPGGKTQVSEPKYAKTNSVNNHQWIDALHLASEVPGFYTRYLATVKEDLGVAITFSVAKDHYDAYLPVFDKVVASLKVFRQQTANLANLRAGNQNANQVEETVFVPDDRPDISTVQKSGSGKTSSGTGDDWWLFIVLGAVVIFIIIKRKKR